jgi:immunity protein 42 of polymorphic toxin system
MTIGDTSTFAIESEITRAFEKLSWRGLGFFVIHVAGQRYGIKSPSQSMLACSFDEVGTRITGRGTHQAPFAEATAIEIANAYSSAVYLDNTGDHTYFGLSEAQFTKTLYSNSLVWAPDGDEAFDDGSYVLQFDVGDRVRLIAFNRPDSLVDPASVREVWVSSETFYNVLREWRNSFIAEWESLPKHD